MLKTGLATILTVILALIPAVVKVLGPSVYLGTMFTIFGHPGRRLGAMVEALVLAFFGTVAGIGWSFLGIYLSELIYPKDHPAAYAIKGILLSVALFFHGYLRSHSPRLFLFVLLFIIVSLVNFTSTVVVVSVATCTNVLYPIASALGILLLINILLYPEFSSAFLGITTIETLGDTVKALRDAGNYFVTTTDDLDLNESLQASTQVCLVLLP